MSSIDKTALVAGAASAVGDVLECDGVAHLHLFAKVTASAGSLIGSVEFGSTPDGAGNLLLPANAPLIATSGNVVLETVSPDASITLAAGGAQILFATTPAGTYLVCIRITNPPRYVVPRFVFTSGGGTVSVVVYAYGFNVKK
jgi:hypothetical protein